MHGTCIGVGISVLPYETCSVCYVGAEPGGPYRAGHAAKEQLVPPGTAQEGWARSSQAPPLSLPIYKGGTSSKLGMMEVGGT